MTQIIIASVITAFILWLVVRHKKKSEQHKKGDYLIDNVSFFKFKDEKK